MKSASKTVLVAAFLAFLVSSSALGRIGESKEQCIERYGKPAVCGETLAFIKGNYFIVCQLSHNVCISMTYESSNGKPTLDEFKEIVNDNPKAGEQWWSSLQVLRIQKMSQSELETLAKIPSQIQRYPNPGEPLVCFRSDGIMAAEKEGRIVLTALPESPLVSGLSKESGQVRESDNPGLCDELLAKYTEFNLNKQKQVIFERFHPVGTAKSIVVHECRTEWKRGKPTNDCDDIIKLVIRFTVYWEGPVEKDGYTKVSVTFDGEVKRYTDCQVLATNGITNSDISNAMIAIGSEYLRKTFQQQQ